MGNGSSDGSGSTGSNLTTGVAIVVAMPALVFFVIEIIYMQRLASAGMPELQWTRSVYLFGAIEALAFSATGYLGGEKLIDSARRRRRLAPKRVNGEAKQAQTTAAEAIGKAKSLKETATLKAQKQPQKAETYSNLGCHRLRYCD
ncbi:MAG TPA: hypothetical protein VJT69_01800 [Pyrinomonadaceae bacterium]|nr:hypothetical protein [Pyrinomonadaceae bacterium]